MRVKTYLSLLSDDELQKVANGLGYGAKLYDVEGEIARRKRIKRGV